MTTKTKTNPAPFVRVPTRIADGTSGLTPTQIYTYLTLVQTARNADAVQAPRLAQWDPECLARAAGVSVRSLARILRVLEDRGFIRMETPRSATVLDAHLVPGAWNKVPAAALWTAKPRLHGVVANLAVAGREDEAFGGRPRLSANALRALFGILLTHDWDTGTSGWSAEFIASRAGMKTPHYHQGLRDLVALGLIEKSDPTYAMTGSRVRRHRVILTLRLDAFEWQPATEDDAEDVTSQFVRQSMTEGTARRASKAARSERQAVVREVDRRRYEIPVSPSVLAPLATSAPVSTAPDVPSPRTRAVDPRAAARAEQYLGSALYQRVGAAFASFTDPAERQFEVARMSAAVNDAITRAGISDLQFEVAIRDAVQDTPDEVLLDAVHAALNSMHAVSVA